MNEELNDPVAYLTDRNKALIDTVTTLQHKLQNAIAERDELKHANAILRAILTNTQVIGRDTSNG